MKQITLDWDTYQKELKAAYDKAVSDQGTLLPRGVECVEKLMSGYIDQKDKAKVYIWLDAAKGALADPEGDANR